MNEIAELERRITAALDRIGRGIGTMAEQGDMAMSPVGRSGDTGAEDDRARLREALETERATTAQLTERVRAIKEKQETIIAGLERKVLRLTQELDVAQSELQRQKQAAEDLVVANRALIAGTDDAPVDRAMAAELAALRAARAAEVAEMAEILAELKPLIGEVA